MIITISVFIFMICAVLGCNYKLFSKLLMTDVKISRYLLQAKKYQTEDVIVTIVRIFAVLFNVTFFIVILASLERDDEFLKNINLGHFVMYYLVDVVLHTFVYSKEIKQRIDLLSYLKANLTTLFNIVVVLITIFFCAKSSYLTQVIQSQNQINYLYINWNGIVLLPLFIIFNILYVTLLKDLTNVKKKSEIDVIHNAIYFLSKTLVFVTIVIVLFMGADTSFALLDYFNLNSFQILILNKLVFLLKFIIASSAISFLIRYKRGENILFRVKSNKFFLYLNTFFVVVILGFKMVVL